jgi:regulator of protease activity HflC (stomatin/prohibitin superfamily)
MSRTSRLARVAALVAGAVVVSGCATATIEPGHRGLLFAPGEGGLQHEVLQPGVHKLGACFIACTSNRVDDFDVTYSTQTEHLAARTAEGLSLDLGVSVIYRPIVSELYQLDTEIGPRYYDEVVGPEFRSATRAVFARRSYADLDRRNVEIEAEIEAEVRRRIAGKHIELSAVTIERLTYAPEVAEAMRRRVAEAAEAARQKAAAESDFAMKKRAAEQEAELRRIRMAPTCPGTTAAVTPAP